MKRILSALLALFIVSPSFAGGLQIPPSAPYTPSAYPYSTNASQSITGQDRQGTTTRQSPATVAGAAGFTLFQTRSAVVSGGYQTCCGVAGGWRAQAVDSTPGDTGYNVVLNGTTSYSGSTCPLRRPGSIVTMIDMTGSVLGVAVDKKFNQKIPLTTLTGNLEVWAYIPTITAGGLSINLRASSDVPGADPPTTTPTNYYQQGFLNATEQQGVWSPLILRVGGTTIANGAGGAAQTTVSAPTTSIDWLEIEAITSTNTPVNQRYICIDQEAFNGKAIPQVVVGFDGFSYSSHNTIVYPLMMGQYNLPFYVAGDGNSIAANLSNLQSLYANGIDILTQGMNHTNYANNPSQLVTDVPVARGLMLGAGFYRCQDCFAYPFNANTPTTDTTLRSFGYRLTRGTPLGQPVTYRTSLGHYDYVSTWGCYDMDNQTAAALEAVQTEAENQGHDQCYYGHDIIAGPITDTATQMLTSEFTAWVNWLAVEQYAGRISMHSPSQYEARVVN